MSSKVRFIWFYVLASLPVAALSVPGSTAAHDLDEIVRRMDELYRAESSYSEVEMDIVTPHWERTLTMKVWTMGMDQTFIRILSPRKEKGVGTLRIEKEMWNYLPKTNKVIKVPPSMMMGSWMGSDFTNDDLVNEVTFIDDYTYEFTSVEPAEPGVLYVKAVPNDGVPVVWGYLIMCVRESDYLPVWEKYYDEKGRLMRTLNFSDIQMFGDRKLPSTLEMIPARKEGNRTVVRYTKCEFDVAIDKAIFSLRNLRSPE